MACPHAKGLKVETAVPWPLLSLRSEHGKLGLQMNAPFEGNWKLRYYF